MARRGGSNVEDLFSIAAALPWWLALSLAPISFFLLRAVADGKPPTVTSLQDMDTAVLHGYLVAFAGIGQFLLPIVFAFGAAMSFMRKVKAAKLVDRLASNSEDNGIELGKVPASKRGATAAMSWRV